MDVPAQYVPHDSNPIILAPPAPENDGRSAEVGVEVARVVGAPSVERWLDNAGLNPYAFRLLGRISRRAGRRGASFESVPNMAAACAMNERTAQRYLRILVASGFVQTKRPATPKTPAHYGVTSKLHVGDEQLLALFVPAWVDDQQLSPQAFRLLFHYISRSYDGEVRADHSRAVRTCGFYRPGVRAAEAELVERELLEFTERHGNKNVFRVTCLPSDPSLSTESPLLVDTVTPACLLSHPSTPTDTPQLVYSVTPTCLLSHPRLSTESPKGLDLKSSLKEEADGGGETFEDKTPLTSSNPEATTLHQGKVKTSQEGKARPSSDTSTTNLQPTEKPQESEAVRFFIDLASIIFVKRLRNREGEHADGLLERWFREYGCEFVTKAWQVAHDPAHRVEGKAEMWVFEDYLSRQRPLPNPLLRLLEEASKEKAAKRAELLHTDLEDGDLFEWLDGQTYVVYGKPEQGQVNGIKPGGDVLDRKAYPVGECKSLRYDIQRGDLFTIEIKGRTETFTADDEPYKGLVGGIKLGESQVWAYRLERCKLIKRAEQLEAEAAHAQAQRVSMESGAALQPA